MVRRSGVANVDSETESPLYPDDPPAWPGPSADQGSQSSRPAPPKAPWSGSGGRWTIWPMRIILWAAIVVIGYRGVMAIVLNETPPAAGTGSGSAAPAASASPGSQFPATLAEAYALNFGRVYLNYSASSAADRAQALAQFLPQALSSAQPQLGFNGAGSLSMSSESIAGIDVRSAHSAVVDLLAVVNDRLMEFGIPIYAADNGSLAVTGLPAVLPAPATAQPQQTQQPQPDPNATSQLQDQLPLFFAAYASGNSAELARYLAPGASVAGLSAGTVTFKGIAALYVPPGGTTRDNVVVTVNWQLTGQQGGFATTYSMSVLEQGGGKWYVRGIGAST